MTGRVDDVWATLKAQKASSRSRAKSGQSLPEVQPISKKDGHQTKINAMDGPAEAPREMQEILSKAHVPQPSSSHRHEEAAAFLAPLQRDINCMTDPDRQVRLVAVRKIRKALQTSDCLSAELLQAVAQGALHRNVIAMLADPVEACREAAIGIISHIAGTAADISPFLPFTLAALKQRMGVGRTAAEESSEELRLAIAYLVQLLLEAVTDASAQQHSADLVALLVRIMEDTFHDMKKAGFAGVISLAGVLPDQVLNEALPKLLEPICAAFHHPHSRVRAAALDAMRELLQRACASDEVLSKTVVPALKTVIIDRSSSIRDAAYAAVASWLGANASQPCSAATQECDAQHLLPVLLLGVTDPSAEVAAHALALMQSVGQNYCDTVLDAGAQPADQASDASAQAAPGSATKQAQPDAASTSHAQMQAAAAAAALPAPFTERAPEHARRMVQHVLPAVLPPALREVREWTVALRLTASRSMFAMAAFAEAALQPHLPTLLPALCNAVSDTDEAIALRVVSTAQVLGAFCEVRAGSARIYQDICFCNVSHAVSTVQQR